MASVWQGVKSTFENFWISNLYVFSYFYSQIEIVLVIDLYVFLTHPVSELFFFFSKNKQENFVGYLFFVFVVRRNVKLSQTMSENCSHVLLVDIVLLTDV